VANFLNAGTMGKAYDWTTKKIRGLLMGGAALAGGAIATKAMTSRTATGAAERLKKISPTLGLAFEKKIKGLQEAEIKRRTESLSATDDVGLLFSMLKDSRYQRPETQLAILSRIAEIRNGAHLSNPEAYKKYLALKDRYKDTAAIKLIEKRMPSWKEIPENYSQLGPKEQNETMQAFIKKILDTSRNKESAKETSWLAMLQDIESRGLLNSASPELFSNLTGNQFINIISNVPPNQRFEFVKKYILDPYKQTGRDLEKENPELFKWLTSSTLGAGILTRKEKEEIEQKMKMPPPPSNLPNQTLSGGPPYYQSSSGP
jgi:hypothetical protein